MIKSKLFGSKLESEYENQSKPENRQVPATIRKKTQDFLYLIGGKLTMFLSYSLYHIKMLLDFDN